MADSKSIPADADALATHISELLQHSSAAYEFALELSTLFEGIEGLESSPKWVFTLSRMAGRVTENADIAHVRALRVCSALGLERV
ncbi:hypothetical protein [Xylophilus sp. ASV27]|uniref:hypothetical protein n=1 Tax=Xylophilus sp. ASV27 TaxID=2795129 RepID=UPI0018EB8648|nr:hypothetical protein [Xylophilus sp. ASV27]